MGRKKKSPKDVPSGCPFCTSEELKDGKCQECGAWTDSYGILHRKNCSGGFHEECPATDQLDTDEDEDDDDLL